MEASAAFHSASVAPIALESDKIPVPEWNVPVISPIVAPSFVNESESELDE